MQDSRCSSRLFIEREFVGRLLGFDDYVSRCLLFFAVFETILISAFYFSDMVLENVVE